MYNDLNLKLEQAQQGMFIFNKMSSKIKELEKQQHTLESKMLELKSELNKENSDVEKLEEKSLTNMFYSLLGKLEERIDKEEAEAVAAQLKYDQAVKDLENIKTEIDKLYAQRMQYRDCEQEYKSLYEQKKNLLMMSNGQTAQLIMDLHKQLQTSTNNLKEIDEAISAGKSVIACLDSACKSLSSAQGWGTWDMLGGGLISDLAKHSHIDDAKSQVEQAQSLLRRFKTELADIQIDSNIQIETDGFAKFADFFFDGLIADWVMQSKIQNSYQSVTQVQSKVNSVLNKLRTLENQEKGKVTKAKNAINEMIINQQ